MTLSVDWANKIITVPKADLTLVTGAYYTYDTDVMRLELKALEDDAAGMPWPDTHQHSTEVTVAGVTYARFFEIINGYMVEFEDPGGAPGQYAVGLTGTNNNVFEEGVLVHNQVSVIGSNAAGLINVDSPSAVESLNLIRGLYGMWGG